jgi:RNA polymerase sigma factor (TIGR02999 family)
VDFQRLEWQHRAQFFALLAQVMRHVLVDAARARRAHKRGGGAIQVSLDEAVNVSPENNESFLVLNDALEALSQVAPRQAKVVELRYFGGLSEEDTAEVMKTSPRTVSRDCNSPERGSCANCGVAGPPPIPRPPARGVARRFSRKP